MIKKSIDLSKNAFFIGIAVFNTGTKIQISSSLVPLFLVGLLYLQDVRFHLLLFYEDTFCI